MTAPASTLTLVEKSVLVKPRGRISAGTHSLPFAFPLIGIGGEPLLETYRGKLVSVSYLLRVRIDRGIFSRTLEGTLEMAVKLRPERGSLGICSSDASVRSGDDNGSGGGGGGGGVTPIRINSTPESVAEDTVAARSTVLPNFRIRGRLDRTVWALGGAVTGEVVVASSSLPTRSIDLRLVRIESVCRYEFDDGVDRTSFSAVKSEVETIQIAEGDIPHGVPLPLYLPLPRLIVCPTVVRAAFKIEYVLELMVFFVDGTVITETYPVILYRAR